MEYRPFHLASEWRKQGHHVEIVAASFSHVRQTQPKTESWFNQQSIEGVHFTWLKTPHYLGNGVRRLINIFCFLFQLFRYSVSGLKTTPDVIIASSTYPLDIYVCRYMAKRFKAKLVFEVHDLWPLSPIELGGVSKNHPLMLLMQHAENYAYKHADAVISMLPCALEHMKSHGLAESKYFHIPNGVLVEDEGSLEEPPYEHLQVIEDLRRSGDSFLVAYAGAFGVANDLESFILSATHLPGSVSLILIGQGPEEQKLKNLTSSLNLKNVHFLSAVKKTQVLGLFTKMDALYIGLRDQPLFRFGVSPNKLMDYMMAARPIIYAVNSGNHPVLEAGCGIETKPGDPAKIAESILEMSQKSLSNRDSMGQQGQDYIIKNHSYKTLAEKFLKILGELA